MLLTVAVSLLLLFSSLAVAQDAPCSVPLQNMAVYEGTLNTLIYFPASPNGVKWTVLPTSDELAPVDIVNYNDTVDPLYVADYAFNSSSGLTIKNATTTAESGHQLSTSGLYNVSCAGGNHSSFKILVARREPKCSMTKPNATSIQVTCSAIYADSTHDPIAAIFSFYVNGTFNGSDTPQRTKNDEFTWISTATFTFAYSSFSTYQSVLTFGQPKEIQDSDIAMNAPTFNHIIWSLEATGQRPSGSLTRKPINTAAVDGSNNITLECSSIYGADAISWYFTPLGSFINQPILISNGNQLFPTDQQKYELHATYDSSLLIVRQLSNETEGNYSCYDGVESAAARLLVIPFPISMEPLYGPVVGGTSITITGSAIIDHLSNNVGSYNIPDLRDAANVYIGNDWSATSVLKVNTSTAFELVAVTPNSTEASIRQPLPIIIEFSPVYVAQFNMTFNKAFTYLPNPGITSLYPDSFIVNGGTLLDVFGTNLSSVAKKFIQLKVVICRASENKFTSNTTTRICTPGNDTYMRCPMPPLYLPNDFLEILNSMYDTNASRSRPNTIPTDESTTSSLSLLCRSKSDVNVLSVPGPNGKDRADVYLGFILDGYKEYENINDALPNTKFIYYSSPEISSSNELIEFDPSEDELIYIKGRYMQRGVILRDYLVHIGNQSCTNNDLQDNQLSCRPPKVEPPSTVNDTNICKQYLSVRITLGYKQYQYACLTYTDRSKRLALIVGLTVGLGGFAIVLIILIVCMVRCRRKKIGLSQENVIYQNYGEVELRKRDLTNAERPVSPDEINIIYTAPRTISLYPDDDLESQHNYDHQIEEYDYDLTASDEYLNLSDGVTDL